VEQLAKFITDERTGLKYELCGDYYIIAGEDEPEHEPIGIWGQRHLHYIQKHCKDFYHKMLIETFPDDIENMIVDFFEFATRAVDDRGFAINVAAFMTASLRGYTDTELLLLIDKMGFFAHPEWFSFRNQSIAVITNHNFPLKFAECDLYCFRKYLEDIVYKIT